MTSQFIEMGGWRIPTRSGSVGFESEAPYAGEGGERDGTWLLDFKILREVLRLGGWTELWHV